MSTHNIFLNGVVRSVFSRPAIRSENFENISRPDVAIHRHLDALPEQIIFLPYEILE